MVQMTVRVAHYKHWDAVRCADVGDIANTIKERGMNNRLAERIQKFLKRLVDDHGSIDLEWLRDVPQRVFAERTQCWSPYKSISGLDCARFGKAFCTKSKPNCNACLSVLHKVGFPVRWLMNRLFCKVSIDMRFDLLQWREYAHGWTKTFMAYIVYCKLAFMSLKLESLHLFQFCRRTCGDSPRSSTKHGSALAFWNKVHERRINVEEGETQVLLSDLSISLSHLTVDCFLINSTPSPYTNSHLEKPQDFSVATAPKSLTLITTVELALQTLGNLAIFHP
ncbi:hypothetical protein KIW84_015690 [Lathyrus oleraceus]|uniref:Uncharacterized protein n=1 Tax=Pisum sativum TaxID=3888 RepID=A0A9D5BR94_PEA|nr:hypothetical protein KIW84_015690 [Pisum sativum]